MCMQDVAIARASKSFETSASINNVAFSELVQEDFDRFSIVISAPPSGNILISLNPIGNAVDGIRLTSGQPPLVLDVLRHGDMVTRQMFALHSAGTVTITCWQSILVVPKGILSRIWNSIIGGK